MLLYMCSQLKGAGAIEIGEERQCQIQTIDKIGLPHFIIFYYVKLKQ